MEARLYSTDLGLRKKELDLLSLLAGRRPAALRREAIATRVWGTEHVSDNSIDVTTSGLRDKLQGALSEEGSSAGSSSPGSSTSDSSTSDSSTSDSSTSDSLSNGTPRLQIETIRGVGYRLALGPEGPEPTGEA